MNEVKVSISVQLPEERFKQLSEMSLRTGVLKSNLVRSWIFEMLDKEEGQRRAA